MTITTRIISSVNCPTCKFYLKELARMQFSHEIYDADDEKNQSQLDVWKISNMPVVQLVDENHNLLYQFQVGTIGPRIIERKIKILLKENKK